MYAMTTPDQRTTETWRMQFSSTARCVSLVRRQVELHLNHWKYTQEDIERVLLVASELATNAVQHGHVPGHLFEVALTSNSNTCLIEVSDASPRMPKALTPTAADERGRGLRLVTALSAQVGHQPRHPLGKTVWARLLCTSEEQR
jgi:anti-sigma regulatory factor (Ser/Thr protein kinase)